MIRAISSVLVVFLPIVSGLGAVYLAVDLIREGYPILGLAPLVALIFIALVTFVYNVQDHGRLK